MPCSILRLLIHAGGGQDHPPDGCLSLSRPTQGSREKERERERAPACRVSLLMVSNHRTQSPRPAMG